MNWGESPVCSPVSTFVVSPLITALTVPWDGEEKAEDDTIPSPIWAELLTTPSGSIAVTLPLVTVPTVVISDCKKC